MNWKITYYNESVEEAILDLPDTLLARYMKLTELMKEYGMNIGMPHTKALGKGLFELRLKGKEGIARVFYCTIVQREILILHVIIKKTQKIPKQELDFINKLLRRVKP